MFWLATEDHDVAEVNHTFVFGPDHRPIQLSVDAEGASERPVGAIPIAAPPVDRLREVLAGFPYGEEVAEMVRAAYQPASPSERHSVRCWSDCSRAAACCLSILWMNPCGDWRRRCCRKPCGRTKACMRNLIERGKDLEAAGYHAQVHVEAKTSLVFLLDGERRARCGGKTASTLQSEQPQIFGGGADRSRGTIIA